MITDIDAIITRHITNNAICTNIERDNNSTRCRSKPYVAFGNDLLGSEAEQTWAFNYNSGVYQLVKGDLLLQFDGTKTTAVYRYKTDKLLKKNLVNQLPEQQEMELFIKAIIQQYMSRMNENRLLPTANP